MAFFTLSEPGYRASSWHRNILNGLIAEKQQKRLNLILLNVPEDLANYPHEEKEAIILIGSASHWIRSITADLEKIFSNRIVVLGNHVNMLNNHTYSVVSSDIFAEIKTLYGYLKHYGKHKIAMYGINPDSSSDAFKQACFLSCGASPEDLYFNSETLHHCFEVFEKHIGDYDGVICTNDYAAVSLVRHLKKDHGLFITSCGGKMLSQLSSPSITHTQSDYEAFGRSSIELCRQLQNNSHIHSIHMFLACNFFAGETTQYLPLSSEPASIAQVGNGITTGSSRFYDDAEIQDMMKMEAVLNDCSQNDLIILECLMRNETYSAIAEKCFISTNGLQYKLKKWFQLCNVQSKSEFVAIIKKYMR